MVDEEALRAVRTSLEADGYRLEVREDAGERVGVRIVATPEACEDCLVPKPLMRSILGPALGVAEESIDLTYPGEDDGAGSPGP